MPPYESGEFEPPAPVARARVGGPGQMAQTNVPLLLDSGADVSVIPLSVARVGGASVEPAAVPVRFLGGDMVTYEQAMLTVEFGRYRFRGMFLVADVEYGVLGRNILNLLVLTLDGPGLS
ncbi:MAG: aspartyl protease family protein, partial [Candidatus Dormibacteraceae bacterium]